MTRPSELNPFPYVLNNPIGSIDPLGLKSNGGCEKDNDCPCGEWEGTSFFGLATFWGGGITVDRVFWTCKCSDAYCEAVYFCFGGGGIGEISVDVVGRATATKAYERSALAGWTRGWRGATGASFLGFSMTVTKGLNNEAVIKHVSGGASLGYGFARITCITISTTCN